MIYGRSVSEMHETWNVQEERSVDQSKLQKRRILYVQLGSGVGGGIINGLYPIVAGLDRDRYEPIVLFYWPNPYRQRFEALGVKTLLFAKPKPWKHPIPIVQAQKTGLVTRLQKGKSRCGTLYHVLGSYLRLGYYIPQILRLARCMRNLHIDLVHLNSSGIGHGREIVLAAKLTGLPCVCHVQDFGEFQAADRLVARFVGQYIFCSDAIGQHCMAQGRIAPNRGRTVRYGLCNVEKWSRSYDTSQVRREIGWSEKDFVVGNIGRLVPWKGQDVFIRALAEVKQEVPDVKGLVVGGPDARKGQAFYEQLLALRESLNLADNVHFTGFRDDIPRIMASVDVVVHSASRPEPGGTVVSEAMFAGRPVIATDAGGVPEIIDDGVTGLLIPLNDPHAMALGILCIYRDRPLAERMGIAARQKAEEQFDLRRYVVEVESMYEAALGILRNNSHSVHTM